MAEAVDLVSIIKNAEFFNIPIKHVANLIGAPESKIILARKVYADTGSAQKVYEILDNSTIYTLDELKKILLDFIKDTSITKLILTGSYARGTATQYSDVDIIIESDDIVEDYETAVSELSAKLGKRVDVLTTAAINSSIYKDSLEEGSILIYGA